MNMKSAKTVSVRVGPKLFVIFAILTGVLAIVKLSWVTTMPWIVVWSPLLVWAGFVALIFAVWVIILALIFLISLLARK
jgi:uncharacterized YccA/Bax inhibitor family protein